MVQQGMNDRSGLARRYHWHSANVSDFVEEPHAGIAGEHQGTIMNLVDAPGGTGAECSAHDRAARARKRRCAELQTSDDARGIMKCVRRTWI